MRSLQLRRVRRGYAAEHPRADGPKRPHFGESYHREKLTVKSALAAANGRPLPP
jgi:hypothetical protein